MTALPRLTEPAIRDWVGEGSFQRGRRYFRQGHILNPRQQPNTLKALCQGSRPHPYHVEVLLAEKGIVAGGCSCPVGARGRCKHVAALLLTWLHGSESFVEEPDLETTLSQHSKGELFTLIRWMVDRYPDLETLLQLPMAGSIGEQQPLDPEVIRRQVNNAFLEITEYGYGGTFDSLWRDLDGLVAIGDEYTRQEDWANAATVFQTVAQEIPNHILMIRDDDGVLIEVVNDCVDGLGKCLKATDDPIWRESLLQALFEVYRRDVEFGGIDLGYAVTDIIMEQASLAEKRQVSRWARDALHRGDRPDDEFRRQFYGHFLLALEKDWLDDEAYLRLCRETSRWQDLVGRLLNLGRMEEAVATAREVGEYDLLQLAEIFVGHGYSAQAEQLVRERAETGQDTRLTKWLVVQARKRGDLVEALTLTEFLFWHRPSVQIFQELRDLARPLARWDSLRTTLLDQLAEQTKYALLTRIYVEEGDVDQALAALEQTATVPWGRTPSLALQVAEVAEDSRPHAAIDLYVEEVERLIAARGRGNYAEAAIYLKRVRDLHNRLGEQVTWQSYIAGLREGNPRLRALKDELTKAGL